MATAKLKPFKTALTAQLQAMPVPGVLDLTDAPWRPCPIWIRKQADLLGRYFSVRRYDNRYFVFRLQ